MAQIYTPIMVYKYTSESNVSHGAVVGQYNLHPLLVHFWYTTVPI